MDEENVGSGAIPKLTLEEALERYRIEGDWEEDYKRGGWQDDAAKEVIDKMNQ